MNTTEDTELLLKRLQEAEQAARLAPPEPNKFEVRGYEIAKLKVDGSWETVGKYRPTELALAEANASCTFLQRRNPLKRYAVRVLISAELPKVPTDGPMVLDADEPAVEPPDSNPYGMLREAPAGVVECWKLPAEAPLPHVVSDEDLPAAIAAHQQEVNA